MIFILNITQLLQVIFISISLFSLLQMDAENGNILENYLEV